MVIVALLVTAGIPLGTNWIYSSMTHAARTQLIESFNMAKALALRNQTAVALPSAAAGMRVTTNGTTTTIYVCTGSSSAAAACTVGGSSLQWSTTYSGRVATSINSVVATSASPLTLDIDNRGEPLTGTSFALTLGGATNNETGTLH